jgi:hypothetical protein
MPVTVATGSELDSELALRPAAAGHGSGGTTTTTRVTTVLRLVTVPVARTRMIRVGQAALSAHE